MASVASCWQYSHWAVRLQADTTDTEYGQTSGVGAQQDFLDGPEARQRVLSIASAITSTVEGRYHTCGMALAHCCGSEIKVLTGLFLTRTGGVKKEVSTMLVYFLPNVPDLGLLSTMVEDQESG